MNLATRTAQEPVERFSSAELKVPSISMEPLLTVNDLERLLQVNKRTIDRLWRRGQLPRPFKVGGQNRWQRGTIAVAIEDMESPMNVG